MAGTRPVSRLGRGWALKGDRERKTMYAYCLHAGTLRLATVPDPTPQVHGSARPNAHKTSWPGWASPSPTAAHPCRLGPPGPYQSPSSLPNCCTRWHLPIRSAGTAAHGPYVPLPSFPALAPVPGPPCFGYPRTRVGAELPERHSVVVSWVGGERLQHAVAQDEACGSGAGSSFKGSWHGDDGQKESGAATWPLARELR